MVINFKKDCVNVQFLGSLFRLRPDPVRLLQEDPGLRGRGQPEELQDGGPGGDHQAGAAGQEGDHAQRHREGGYLLALHLGHG